MGGSPAYSGKLWYIRTWWLMVRLLDCLPLNFRFIKNHACDEMSEILMLNYPNHFEVISIGYES